ncbi:MAG: FmdE family protein [Desulfobacterales bacterium]|jgi:formylmethanofuran dehydrogenase subunit E|nr:FmdE family protein [Desulfobacterales bacterium]
MNPLYTDIIGFHGHSCPGLAIGYRMTQAALSLLSESRAEDEEIVAIVENNACGVDALQFMTGCTFGKGNLIFKDYGKHAFTLFSRKTKQGARVIFNFSKITEDMRKDKENLVQWLLAVPEKEIISLKKVHVEEPEPARIFRSVKCEFCGEDVMETRIRTVEGKTSCIPCAEKQYKQQ